VDGVIQEEEEEEVQLRSNELMIYDNSGV